MKAGGGGCILSKDVKVQGRQSHAATGAEIGCTYHIDLWQCCVRRTRWLPSSILVLLFGAPPKAGCAKAAVIG